MTDPANSPQEIVKNTLEQLTPKDRKTVLTEIIRNRLPDALQKDLVAETAQTLPGAVKKDAVAEAAQTLTTEARKEVVAEATRTLPAEVKRDVVARTVQGMSTSKGCLQKTGRTSPLEPSMTFQSKIDKISPGTRVSV